MTQLAIQIPDELGAFIDRSVKTGAFDGAGDFLVNLLYIAQAQSESEVSGEDEAKLSALRAEIGIGLEQAERGDFVEFTAADIIREGRARRLELANS